MFKEREDSCVRKKSSPAEGTNLTLYHETGGDRLSSCGLSIFREKELTAPSGVSR